MDNDREFDRILMNVKNASGSVTMAAIFTVGASLKLLIYLLRLAKKGLLATKSVNDFKSFMQLTEGKYTVYNIPLSKGRAQAVQKLGELERQLENAHGINRIKIQNQIRDMRKDVPELGQLEKLGIAHCVLPKLNGSSQTIQVAVANTDEQPFKNWFLNHLQAGLSGGAKHLEELNVFTEGNYTIFNLPTEDMEEIGKALADFNVLKINYAVLPDLNVGDGKTQIAIANADRGKFEKWAQMWKKQRISEGKEDEEITSMDAQGYTDTAKTTTEEIIKDSDPQYQEANREFEQDATPAPGVDKIQSENSKEFTELDKNSDYRKITVNEETLVKHKDVETVPGVDKMRKEGYFVSRIPSTYGERMRVLIVPNRQVFAVEDKTAKTYVVFLPRNGNVQIADKNGTVTEMKTGEICDAYYNRVERGIHGAENLMREAPAQEAAQRTPAQEAAQNAPTPDAAKAAKAAKAAAPTPKL